MMPAEPDHRRLAAIMFTDMVGYSALTQRNEGLALALLHEQQRLVRPIFAQYGGREVKSTGDGFLVEFSSALQAVRCAIAIQTALVEQNASAAAERRIQVRIGLHLGDVEVRDGDVFGDGVNIAARIEPLAEAGGICITRPVHDQVHTKIDLPLVPIGQPQLKNIQVPIDVYRVVLPWTQGTPARSRQSTSAKTARLPTVAAVLATLLAIAGAIMWRYQQPAATTSQASPSPVAPTPLAHAEDRKSVAVLPFANMSPDAADEYLSDGMTEEIITALSKVTGLHVAARTSSFAFKGKNEDIEKIGAQLHVGVVLEGSVAKAGTKLRITTQLINIADGYHLWSETYDRDMQDMFAIRTDVAQRVADALKVELGVDARQRIAQKPTDHVEAYQLYLKGRYFMRQYTIAGFAKSAEYFRQAVAVDPSYALAHAGLASYYVNTTDWFLVPEDAMPKGREEALKALEIDDTLAEAHVWLASVAFWYDRDWSTAEREFRRAIALDPNSASAHQFYGGYFLNAMGRFDEAIAAGRRAVEIDPLSPEASWLLALSLTAARRFDEAIAQYQRLLDLDPNYAVGYGWLGSAYAWSGAVQQGIVELHTARSLDPANPWILSLLGCAYARGGQREAALKVIDELQDRSRFPHALPSGIAAVYAGLGANDKAFEWLDRAYEGRSGDLVWLKTGGIFDNLRADPRFTALVKKMGLDQ